MTIRLLFNNISSKVATRAVIPDMIALVVGCSIMPVFVFVSTLNRVGTFVLDLHSQLLALAMALLLTLLELLLQLLLLQLQLLLVLVLMLLLLLVLVLLLLLLKL